MFNYFNLNYCMNWFILTALVVFTLFCFYKARRRHKKHYKSYEEYLSAIDFEGRCRWKALASVLAIIDVVYFFLYVI